MPKLIFKFFTYLYIFFCFISVLKAQNLDESTVIAKVNEKEIKLGHLILTASNLPENYKDLPNDYIFNLILDQIIKQEIISQNFQGNDLILNLNLENQKRTLKASQAMNEILNDYPTEKDLNKAYEKIKASFANQKEYNASHILLETENEAIEILNQLKEGKSFENLAKNYSIGPSAENGGSLGWFSTGQMVPEFEAAALMLEIEEVSSPIQTQFGWHIIKLNNQRIKSIQELKELRNEITQSLQQEFIENYINKIAEEMKIEILIEDIDPNLIRKERILAD